MKVCELIEELQTKFDPESQVWVGKIGDCVGDKLSVVGCAEVLGDEITTKGAFEGDCVLKSDLAGQSG